MLTQLCPKVFLIAVPLSCTIYVTLLDIVNVSQIWSTQIGYEELAVQFNLSLRTPPLQYRNLLIVHNSLGPEVVLNLNRVSTSTLQTLL